MAETPARVAVIGAGPAGLAAIKSLKQEGFSVTGFERRSNVGGLWALTDDPECTSVTTATRYQMSKFIACFTDFPFPDDFPRFPTAEHMLKYYQSYAEHFGLADHIRFNTVVTSIRRSDDDKAWLIDIEGEGEARSFDKVLIAAGTETIPKPMPKFEGRELFEGNVIHSQAFKRAEDLKGLNVLVIGQGNTACDCAVELAPHAKTVYLAHRRRAVVIPRNVDGQRYDRFLTWRLSRISLWIQAHAPWLHRRLMHLQLSGVARKAWGGNGNGNGKGEEEDALLGVSPTLATNIASLVVNDDMVPLLRSGGIKATGAVTRFVGPRDVETEGGEVVRDVDVVIACTGYTSSLGLLAPGVLEYHGDDDTPPSSSSSSSKKQEDDETATPKVPRLYRNVFPPRWAGSLACLNHLVLIHAAVQREVAGMAVAQVWAGKTALPARGTMEAQADEQVRGYLARCRSSDRVTQPEGLVVDAYGWLRWVDGAAGCGVYESLGWTRRGLLFFVREPRLCLLMAWGVNSPHIYSLFETGKRKAWDGAREAILRVNEQSAADARLGAEGAHPTVAES